MYDCENSTAPVEEGSDALGHQAWFSEHVDMNSMKPAKCLNTPSGGMQNSIRIP